MATSMVHKNIPFLKSQFSAVLGNSSVVVKVLCVAILAGYFLSFSRTILDIFTVIPGYVLPPNFYIWSFATHNFIEVHIWNVCIDLVVIVLYGKLLEPLWGALEMLVFFVVVNLSVAVMTTSVYLGVYSVTRNTDLYFHTHIHGLAGYLGGFAVAVKQVMPDHVLINSPFGKLRNKHVPFMLFAIAIIMRLIFIVDGPYPIMFGCGLFVSWVYLRFYQKHANGNRGDLTDTFSFSSFFPIALQPFVAVLSNSVFAALVKMKLCNKPQRKYNISSPNTITVSLPGTEPADAERRRQLALKALNERLSKSDAPPSWPSLEEEGDSPATPLMTSPEVTPPPAAPPAATAVQVETPVAEMKLPVPDFREQQQKTQNQ